MSEIFEAGIWGFVIITVIIGGGAAYLTGRAIAHTWRPLVLLALYSVFLAMAVRFVHYALAGGELFSLQFLVVDLVIVLVFAGLGFRITRAGQMSGQYSWIYRRNSPITWEEKRQKPADA